MSHKIRSFLNPNIFQSSGGPSLVYMGLTFWWCRIHEGGVPYGDWFRGDGIRRLLREADLHSDQQHHRWVFLGNASDSIFPFFF